MARFQGEVQNRSGPVGMWCREPGVACGAVGADSLRRAPGPPALRSTVSRQPRISFISNKSHPAMFPRRGGRARILGAAPQESEVRARARKAGTSFAVEEGMRRWMAMATLAGRREVDRQGTMRLIRDSLPGVMGKVSQNSRLDLAVSGSAARTSVRTHRLALPFAGVLALALPAACTKSPLPTPRPEQAALRAAPPPRPPPVRAEPLRAARSPSTTRPPPSTPAPAPCSAALFPQTPIMSDMDWPSTRTRATPTASQRSTRRSASATSAGGQGRRRPRGAPEAELPRGVVRAGRRRVRLRSVRDARHEPPELRLAAHPPYPRPAAPVPVWLQHHERHAALQVQLPRRRSG